MENKQSFKLSQVQQKKIIDILFKINAITRYLTFLGKQLNYLKDEDKTFIYEQFRFYSEKIINLYEEQDRIYFQLDEQYKINILDIPNINNISYDIIPEKGVIVYTYDV